MMEWLFPSWSNPTLLTLVVEGRALVNTILSALVAGAPKQTGGVTIGAVILTVVSVGFMVSVLHGVLGRKASYLEILLQLVLVGLAWYVVYPTASIIRLVGLIVTSVVAIGLLLVMIPLYGEATVAS